MTAASADSTLDVPGIVVPSHAGPAVQSGIRERLLGGIGWSAAASVLAQGCSFLTMVLLARLMGREPFGQFALIQSTMVSLTTVSGLGLGITATKYVSQYRVTDPAKAGRILGLSALVTLAAAILFTAGLGLSTRYASLAVGRSTEFQSALRISMVYVFFITITCSQTGGLAGFEAFRKIATINAIYGFVTLASSWILAMRWGLRGAVWGQGIGAFLLWMMNEASLTTHCRGREIVIRYRRVWEERHVLLGFAIPAAACGMVSSAATWSANVLLVRRSGFTELAIFSAALSLRSVVLFVPALVLRVSTPLLNNLLAARQDAAYRRVFLSITGLNLAIALSAAIILSLAGSRILHLFGKDFSSAGWLPPILLAAVVLEAFSNNLFQALFTSGRLWRHLAILSFWAVLLLAGAAGVSPRYGASGLAASYFMAWLVSAALYSIAARRQLHHRGSHAGT
jgi:O-antigen/teichoic acid export membrane protein